MKFNEEFINALGMDKSEILHKWTQEMSARTTRRWSFEACPGPEQRPVPSEVQRAPELQQHLGAFLREARREDTFVDRPMERLEVHKRLLKEARRRGW